MTGQFAQGIRYISHGQKRIWFSGISIMGDEIALWAVFIGAGQSMSGKVDNQPIALSQLLLQKRLSQ